MANVMIDSAADARLDSDSAYWNDAAYLAIVRAGYDAVHDTLTVCFRDGDCATVAAHRLIGRGERHPDWTRLDVVDGMHVMIPTPAEPIELTGFMIRASTDPIFAAHLAREAEMRARRIGARLQALRQTRGRTARQLAEQVGMDAQDVSRVEQGRLAVSYATLDKMLEALGYTFSDLSAAQHDTQTTP